MREIFVGMGSTLIQSVKLRDNWVFAGRAGTQIKSLFEKVGELIAGSLVCSTQKWSSILYYAKKNTMFSLLLTCQLTVNDEKTNAYEEWPEVVEVGGCFPRTVTDVNFKEPLMSRM